MASYGFGLQDACLPGKDRELEIAILHTALNTVKVPGMPGYFMRANPLIYERAEVEQILDRLISYLAKTDAEVKKRSKLIACPYGTPTVTDDDDVYTLLATIEDLRAPVAIREQQEVFNGLTPQLRRTLNRVIAKPAMTHTDFDPNDTKHLFEARGTDPYLYLSEICAKWAVVE